MFCNQCGTHIPDGSLSCANCGAPVVKAQPVPPVPEQTPKKKFRVGLIILLIMGGSILLLLLAIVVLLVAGFLFNYQLPVKEFEGEISYIEPVDGILQDNIYGDVYYRHGGFVLPDSDSRYYCYQDIQMMTEEELTVAEQEIYARHGMAFADSELQAYFMAQDWYAPGSGDFTPNAYEQANLELLRVYRAVEDGSLYRSGNPYVKAFSRNREYAIDFTDYRLLCGEDLEDMTEEQLCVARNEILARRGWIFDDGDLREYFYSKTWYVPSVPGGEFDYSSLSQTEQDNISLIKIYEELGNGNLSWSKNNTYEEVFNSYKKYDYIFPDSSTRALRNSELDGMTEDELCIARNEIFARNGYTFKSRNLMEYFLRKDWYEPIMEVGNSDAILFTPVEKDNIDLLHEAELEAAKNADKIYRSQGDMPDLSKLDRAMGYSASCQAFSVKLPNYWKDYAVVTYEANRISFYERLSREAGFGGSLMQISIWTYDWDYTDMPNYRYLGTFTSPDGETYDLIVTGPSDVQFDWVNMGLYNMMEDEQDRILSTLTAKNGWTYAKG